MQQVTNTATISHESMIQEKVATAVDLTFQVTVRGGKEVVTAQYGVCSDEGVCAYGDPVVTPVRYVVRKVHLPLTFRY